MAQASARAKPSPAADPSRGHRVIDVVEVKVAYGAPAPGFILVPEGFRPADPDALVGEAVEIEPSDGPTFKIAAIIAGIRDHGTTFSLLVEHWPDSIARPKVGWWVAVPAVEALKKEAG